MATTKLLLVTGERLEVEGSPADVAKALENAARSSHGTLAWLREPETEEEVGINVAHVVTVRPGEG